MLISEVPLHLEFSNRFKSCNSSTDLEVNIQWRWYRGTSLIRKCHPLGPYSRTMLRSYGGPRGGGDIFMSEELL